MADDIDGVVDELDAIVARARDERDATGYFAALYRAVTIRVRDDLTRGVFDDPDRMERLDVAFANRYLEAHAAWRASSGPTASWRVAFEAASDGRAIVVQHLVLGINAHINLDLGIAAAEVAPGESLPALRGDFEAINDVLADLSGHARAHLRRISPWLGVLDTAAGRADDDAQGFSIAIARRSAWRFATTLAPLPRDTWTDLIAQRDVRIAGVGARLLQPGPFGFLLRLVRLRESKDVRRNLDVLVSEVD